MPTNSLTQSERKDKLLAVSDEEKVARLLVASKLLWKVLNSLGPPRVVTWKHFPMCRI